MGQRKKTYHNKDWKYIFFRIFVFLLMYASVVFCSAGCAGKDSGEEELIITEKEAPAPEYSLAVVSEGDVARTGHVSCTYLQVEEQEVCFPVSGRRIARVMVGEGDSVVKGQLLAELADEQWESRTEALEYRIARNRILLEHTDKAEDYEISARWLQYLYKSGGTAEEEAALKDSVARLKEDNQLLRKEYEDAIALDTMELEELKEQIAVSSVYAEMDGVVSWQKKDLEGSTCARDEVIMKVIDSSECLFMVEGQEYADWFREGEAVEMYISSGTGAGRYLLLPYRMEEWGDRLTFSLSEEYADSVIEVGARGTMNVVLEKREQVLSVPSRAVHRADGKYYVYIVGAEGMREVRWIETGLYGDDSVEVVSGLEQGEKVIVQ